MSKILVFSLDEPQIIVGKKYKNHPDVEKESNQLFGFVKYKTDTGQENKPENNGIVCAYPEEWMKRRIGINYFIREQRDSMINAITEEDTEYEQYRQLNFFEDFGNYNKEQQPEYENSIGNNTEGTEAPMGATVPDYRIENQPQSNVNIEEGVDDNGNNKENTSTNFSITGQMGFH